MFRQIVDHVLLFCLILNVSSDSFLDKNRVKRADIDLQTCIDNFNVHRDKIIRTQDSQNMGAKYLNEIDLGSREECLRLCCETDNCDVFVFEEKVCLMIIKYMFRKNCRFSEEFWELLLFHCGPPEDFKCKFTHHVNYSSAIMSINRHLPDLESQIKLPNTNRI
ncbi:hypothetical protein NQ317_009789 [Molorchus minor]|uniref:MANSC domain-containing protein n=1 Tax=Molorchus minor TaxID=1323400 RepID=A0ABQ9IS36_9CUCU|nr:hypothetical protein NQ317_009789 [Molorchus minor]